MNRKTNIFYNENIEDSKFLTFNNYTEALTGDILAIDYKLWPSRFICINIENLDKNDFILKLQRYYENKLATLRDNIDNTSILKPLNYLIIFLYWYAYNSKENNDYKSPFQIEKDLYQGNTELLNLVQFNYISDIVEQQYNGTYSDIICTINPNKWQKPVLKFIDNIVGDSDKEIDFDAYINDNMVKLSSSEYLHGWKFEFESDSTKDKLKENIKSPIEDDNITIEDNNYSVYYVKSLIDKLNIEQVINESHDSLKFNLVIPLFNVINTENPYDISNDNIGETLIELNNNVNIPLGIYFTDKEISLSTDGKFSTNWSLLISTQFSAFPFSYDIQQNFDDSQSTKQAYLTFAEILANQTNFTDALLKYDNLVKTLQQRISMLESKVNNISSVQNIDSINQDIITIQTNQSKLINEINKRLDEMNNKIDENKIKWQIKTKNN